ncbi:hypothetical protein BHM03_00022124 [Ensete ventricosum]|nr:hypothetical protein BHM03_00022124 [Ensete ventricosum]
MERHNLTLASKRVHVINLCPMKVSCLCFILYYLCRLPSYVLDTTLSFTQVALLLDLH